MAGGWFKEGSVHDNIDAHIEKAVRKARREMGTGDADRASHRAASETMLSAA